jgi:hypothetical protein
MNGSSECLTVKFETVNKYLAKFKIFFSCFTGKNYRENIDLKVIADKLEPLFSRVNIQNLHTDIRELKLRKTPKGKAAKAAAIRTIEAAAQNLTLIAARKERGSPQDPEAQRLTAIVDRLNSEFGFRANGSRSSTPDNEMSDYRAVRTGDGSSISDGSISEEEMEFRDALDFPDGEDHRSDDSDPLLGFNEVAKTPSPTRKEQRRAAKEQERELAEQMRAQLLQEAAAMRLEQAQAKAKAKADKRLAKAEAAQQEEVAKRDFKLDHQITMTTMFSRAARVQNDPVEVNRLLVLEEENNKKRCKDLIDRHVGQFKGATHENLCLAIIQSLQSVIESKQYKADIRGATGVANADVAGRIAMIEAAHLQVLKDYVNTLRVSA